MVIKQNKMLHLLQILHENPKPIYGAITSIVFALFGNLCRISYNGFELTDLQGLSYCISILSGTLAIAYTCYRFIKDLKKKKR